MKVVIIEDEIVAANTLQRIIAAYDPNIELLEVIRSVNQAVSWLAKNIALVDLIFMDIKLSDGLSFEIFEKIKIHKPTIFTTAFDEYAIQAFRVNSIDYLLKPVNLKDLTRAMEKFALWRTPASGYIDYQQIFSQLKLNEPAYKSRFLVKSGKVLQAIEAKDIAYFVAEGNLVLLKTFGNNSFPVAFPLHRLEEILDPNFFFRVSRNLIIQMESIVKLTSFSKGRLKLELKPTFLNGIIISNQKAIGLKEWLDK
ncbi:MAG: LytTR family DNA-binding domain-containing protein [Saprospiraceae bacterium]